MATTLCEVCGSDIPVAFATYVFRGHAVKVALCGPCSRDEVPAQLLQQKIADGSSMPHMPPPASATVYVVLQAFTDDQHFTGEPSGQPIAVFHAQSEAAQFVAAKRAEEYLHLDWEIVATPLFETDYDATREA